MKNQGLKITCVVSSQYDVFGSLLTLPYAFSDKRFLDTAGSAM